MKGLENERQLFGTGYVVIPEGVDREEYAKSCYNKEQFSIITNDGEFIPNVIAIHQILNDIYLPKTSEQLGTQILFLNTPDQNRPIIYATLSKKGVSAFRTEDDFLNTKVMEGGITGNSCNTKSLSFVSYIKSYFDKASSYLIQVLGNKKSRFQVESSGWIILQFTEGIKLRNKDKELWIYKDKLIYTDEYENTVVIDKGKFMFKNPDLGKGRPRFMMDESGYNLGTINFYDYFSKFFNYVLTQLQVQTAFGPSGSVVGTPIGEPQLRKLIKEFDKINDWKDDIY